MAAIWRVWREGAELPLVMKVPNLAEARTRGNCQLRDGAADHATAVRRSRSAIHRRGRFWRAAQYRPGASTGWSRCGTGPSPSSSKPIVSAFTCSRQSIRRTPFSNSRGLTTSIKLLSGRPGVRCSATSWAASPPRSWPKRPARSPWRVPPAVGRRRHRSDANRQVTFCR
jgi:hypothetical protein